MWISENHYEGALTHYLVEQLRQSKRDTTYREMMALVANRVTAQSPLQHPQVEGDRGRPVLAGSAIREDPSIKIASVSAKQITVGAGAAQGLTVGTILSIYQPDARHLTGIEK